MSGQGMKLESPKAVLCSFKLASLVTRACLSHLDSFFYYFSYRSQLRNNCLMFSVKGQFSITDATEKVSCIVKGIKEG